MTTKVIAIDGLAGSGKGTLAKALAKHYRCQFLPTGNLYRLLARKLMERGVDIDSFVANPDRASLTNIVNSIKAEELLDTTLADEVLSKAASKIAAGRVVREVLNTFQHKWASDQRVAIIEGRDIGTVIFPNANIKFFVTADAPVRAERRTSELKKLGKAVDTDSVLADLLARDARDQGRANAPLKQAPDAIVLDTTRLSASEVAAQAIALIDARSFIPR
jgi:cytidylate kinase